VLATPTRLATLADALAGATCPVYVAAQGVLDAIAGFHVHRGCLAIGQRPSDVQVPTSARTVLVLEDLVSADNLGAAARNAAAFGVDALMLSPRCADPFYRKAVRVSIGAIFQLPVVVCTRWPEDLGALKAAGFELYGAVLDDRAIALPAVRRAEKVALLLGTEGPGLSVDARAACDHLITIPMSPGSDSLNVATAGAVALYHLQQAARA
jgi:tRNA G18 (ribose-2'-O)-methylase SpoU